MDPVKIGLFIKEIRKKNNLTQQDFATKYGVTYQAVSKWENGRNLPDISLLKEISRDYNVSIDELLEGKVKTKNHKKYLIIGLTIIMLIAIILIIIRESKGTFNFKTVSSTCTEFRVTGSMAYDKNKASIYISEIDYCAKEDNEVYDKIECSLYRNEDNILIFTLEEKENVTLDEYLKDLKIIIDNYDTFKNYEENSLYLEINARSKAGKQIRYTIPLRLVDNK